MDDRNDTTVHAWPEAVVWIDDRHAIITRRAGRGPISTLEIKRRAGADDRFLSRIVHEIAARPRVMVLGSAALCQALERRYVAVSHRPDRLMAPPAVARAAGARIAEGLERLPA